MTVEKLLKSAQWALNLCDEIGRSKTKSKLIPEATSLAIELSEAIEGYKAAKQSEIVESEEKKDGALDRTNSIEHWIKDVIEGDGGFLVWEDRECVIFHCKREMGVAEFVIKALANPRCEGSEYVLNEILKRRKEQTTTNQIK